MKNFLATAALFGLLLLSNRWLTFEQGMTELKATDTEHYMALATSFPGQQAHDIPFHQAQRIATPLLVGVVSYLTGISHSTLFLLLTLFLCTTIIFLTYKILSEIRIEPAERFLCMALLILNPYTFRFYLAVPAMVCDLVFVTGVALLVLGLLRNNFRLLFAAMIIASLGRQTALLATPGVALWLWQGRGWSAVSATKRLLAAAACLILASTIYVVTAKLAAASGHGGNNMQWLFGMVTWLRHEPNAHVLVELVARAVVPLAFPMALLAGAGLALGENPIQRKEAWLCLILIASLLSQPFMGDPRIFMGNMNRYSSHAFIFALLPLAMLLADRPRIFKALGPIPQSLLLACIAAGSFHHMYTFIGGSSENAARFALIYLVLAAFCGVLVFIAVRTPTKNQSAIQL